MAKGDVVSDLSDLGPNGILTFQPATGVECVIKTVGTGSGASDMKVKLENGTISSHTEPAINEWNGSLFINNTNYLAVFNGNAGTKPLSYSGVQVK